MRIKPLNLGQIVLPRCFQLMVQHHQSEDDDSSLRRNIIKLIKSDEGIVKIYRRPISAAELMLEFPSHLVCRSDSFYIGRKTPALSHSDRLLPGHDYFLLPVHFFQSVLSFVTIASFATNSQQLPPPLRKAVANCQAFHIQKTPSGSLRVRVSEEFISQLMQIENSGNGVLIPDSSVTDKSMSMSRVCTTPQLQKDYSLLVGSRPCWKPKLETIIENKKKNKFSSFSIKQRRKKASQSLRVPKSSRRSERHLRHRSGK